MDPLALEFRDFSFAYATSIRHVASGKTVARGDSFDNGLPGSNTSDDDSPRPQAPTTAVTGPVNWSVREGAFVLLVGATGSGKTTLLKCAKPEMAPVGKREGEVLVFGEPTNSLNAERSARAVGYVAQSPDNQLVCSTVWHQMAFGLENLGTPQEEMRRRVAEVAHFFNIGPWFDRDVNELSGGQKQLLNLASVLVMRPRLLLLDEPTAQLDPVAEKNFLHALFRLNRELGLTIVMATHAPETAADYATEVVRLQNGTMQPASLVEFRANPAIVSLPLDEASAPSSEAGQHKNSDETEKPKPVHPNAASEPKGCDVLSQGKVAVELCDVYTRYAKEAPWVLRGTDLLVETDTVHALLGGNGCGKSTLLNVIAGTLRCDRGQLRCHLRDEIGFLPQDPKALFACDTVAEELHEWQRTCGYTDAEIDFALQRIGLTQHTQHHPYDLSGGQQQLLALVKLLLTSPHLLLLDEPTKGLDPTCKLKVARLLKAFRASGGTVIMATHDLAFTAALADDVSLLFDGQVTCTEPAAEFFRDNLFYCPVADAFWRAWSPMPASNDTERPRSNRFTSATADASSSDVNQPAPVPVPAPSNEKRGLRG